MHPRQWLAPLLREFFRETARFAWDAWPESFSGRMKEELMGAGQGYTRQHFAEVRKPHTLELRRAIEKLDYVPKLVLFAHYGKKMPIKQRVRLLGIERDDYWELLDQAYLDLASYYGQ